ncbi:MAG: molybdopterin molybdenumtransferase MoeA, partial [Cyanobacteria bacterium J06633_2]
MLHPNDAESKILDLVQPFHAKHDVETIGLLSAQGRVLAQDVVSQLDFPHWDNSAMDGYAVRFGDVSTASQDQPITLTVVEDIPAGYQPQQTIQPGQAARIFTGAIVPDGADTIVIQEN